MVLVHGAWCDGSSWAKVIGPLQQRGHHVVAVQNPLTSLADDVAGLVFVAAYAADEGETVLALGERFDPTPGGAAIRATNDGWLTLDPGMFPSVFAGDIDPADGAVLAAVQKPTHGACFGSPAGPAGWHSLPTAYIRSTHDEMVTPTLQSWLAERAATAVTDLASSHASPVSHGSEVVEVILGVLG